MQTAFSMGFLFEQDGKENALPRWNEWKNSEAFRFFINQKIPARCAGICR
jgi:hypothetical protein